MIVGKNLFNQTTNNDLRTYGNIRKTATGQCDDYTTACFIDYIYLKKHCTLIAINLVKKQKLDAYPKAIQQIHLTGNLDWGAITQKLFIINEAKKTFLDFSKRTVKVLWFYFILIKY